MKSLNQLITKLNPACHKALEKAVNICLARTHYNVEIEHLLLALLEDESNTLVLMFKAAKVRLPKLKGDINNSLEILRKGNDQTPALSLRIIELINAAWLLASLDYNDAQIDSGILLAALIQNPTLNQVCHAISTEFNRLEKTDVPHLMTRCKQSSDETSQKAHKDKAPTSSKTPALDQFTIDLNAQAKAGKIDAVIGRETEIRQVIDILARRRQNNAILTGEPGVGKTAIVEGLALRIVNKDIPSSLQDVIIHTLDMGLLQAGAGVKGEFENRLKTLISEIKNSPHPIILFIDEAHTLIGAGAGQGQNDAANLLKPALARGELRCIAATTWAEYKQYFEKDAALTRRFQVVKIAEPNTLTATQMLRSLQSSFEKHHRVKILDEAIVQATVLAERYISGRQLPDKSISLLDTACARIAGKQTSTPVVLEQAQKQLQNLTQERTQLQLEMERGFDHQDRCTKLQAEIAALKKSSQLLEKQWQQEKNCVNQITAINVEMDSAKTKAERSKLKTKLNKHHQTLAKLQNEAPLMQPYVDGQIVAEVLADWTGIPVGRMVKDEINQVLNIDDILKQRIIGQDHALKTIAASVRTARAKLADPQKPNGVFLFVGPSGIGKTETALNLAELLYGSKDKLTVINMSEFKEEHKISMLAGAPPGYVGYGEGGVLTEAVRRQPYSIILLDEMEKAHPGVQEVFYQVFDKGMLKDGQGRDINFSNTLIIMTTNACSNKITKLCEQADAFATSEELVNLIHDDLIKIFKPAFIGRVTVVPYLPLGDHHLRQIIQLKLDQIQQRVKTEYHLQLTFADTVIRNILQKCQQQAIGARQIDNILTNDILPQISQQFLINVVNETQMGNVIVDCHQGGQFYLKNTPKTAKKTRKTKAPKKPKTTNKILEPST